MVGHGQQGGVIHVGRGGEQHDNDLLPKVKLVVVVRDDQLESVTTLVVEATRTGESGDEIL